MQAILSSTLHLVNQYNEHLITNKKTAISDMNDNKMNATKFPAGAAQRIRLCSRMLKVLEYFNKHCSGCLQDDCSDC